MPFPRGRVKGIKKTASKKKDTFLFNNLGPVPKKRKREHKGEKASKRRKVETTYAHQIRWGQLQAGNAILGVVKEVKDMDAKISLPNMKTGWCSISEISSVLGSLIDEYAESEGQMSDLPSMSALLEVGQVFSFAVLSLEKTKKNFQKIELTLREDIVNQHLDIENLKQGQMLQCCIQSIEDRGFVISTGIEGVRGFYRGKSKQRYVLGQTVMLQIKSIQAEQKVILFEDHNPETVELQPTLGNAFPGQRVEVRIKKILPNGLLCKLIGSELTATIHATHMDRNVDYAEGSTASGRIMFLSHQSKALAVTCLPHLVNDYRGISLPISAGAITNATCVSVSLTELLLELEDSKLDARCHINQVADEPVEKLKEEEYLDQTLQCRVMSTNLLDGLVNVTMKSSVLQRDLMFFEDAKVGMKLKGVVTKVEEHFLLVELAPGIRGAISQVMAGETKQADLRRKYAVDQALEVTVLASMENKKLELTDKKEIVEKNFTVIEDYNVTPNTISKGVVINVHHKGIKLLFFNKVVGYVSREELHNCGYVEKVDDMFQQGQVLACRVLASDPDSRNIICTLNTEISEDSVERPKEGTVVKVKVVGLGAKSVQCVMKSKGARVKCIIPFNLLSDHLKNGQLLREVLEPKTTLRALVLQCMPNYMVLTMKHSLVTANEHKVMPMEFKDVVRNKEYVGYVVSVDTIGVFVRFLGSLTGFAPRTECVHLFGKEPQDIFSTGETVRVRVMDVNAETRRFRVTLRRSVLKKKVAWLQSAWINSLFDELHTVQTHKPNQTNWATYTPGTLHAAAVSSLQPFGCLVKFHGMENAPMGLALKPRHGIESDSDEVRQSVVLDFNEPKNIADVSFNAELLETTLLEELPKKKKVTGVIELLKDGLGYMVLSVAELNCLAFVALSEPNIHFEAREVFEVGQSVECRLLCKHSSGRILATVDLDKIVERHAIQSSGTRQWDFFDVNMKCFTDIKKGSTLEVMVVSKTNTRLQVSLGPSVPIQGIVVKSRQSEAKFDAISVGDKVKVEISKTPQSLNVKYVRLALITRKVPKVGQQCTVLIKGTLREGLNVTYNGRSLFLPVMELSNDVEEVKAYIKGVKSKKALSQWGVGKNLRVVITGKNICSLKQVNYDSSELKIGDVTMCQVRKIVKERGVNVALPGNHSGVMHITNASDFKPDPMGSLSVDEILEVRVIDFDEARSQHVVSVRHREDEIADEVKFADLNENDKVQGYIKAVTKKGCFISLSRNLDCYCMLRDMVDGFVKDLAKVFPVGKLVKGVVTKLDNEKKRVTVSLKRSMQEKQSGLTASSLKPGQNFVGIINNIAKFGLFCTIKDTTLMGLLHKSKIPKDQLPLKEHFSKGQKIGVQVLEVDGKKLSLVMGKDMESDDIGPMDALPSKELMDMAQLDQDEDSSSDDSDEEFEDVSALEVDDAMEIDEKEFMEDSSDDSDSD